MIWNISSVPPRHMSGKNPGKKIQEIFSLCDDQKLGNILDAQLAREWKCETEDFFGISEIFSKQLRIK